MKKEGRGGYRDYRLVDIAMDSCEGVYRAST